MILISILGLDQFVVGHYSKDHTKNIADLLETSCDNVNFYAPYAYMFHEGVEQTSWDVLVRVHLPSKYQVFEKQLSNYFLKTMVDFAINVTVNFEYFDEHHEYQRLSDKYQRFLTDDNLKSDDEEYDEDYHDDKKEN